MEINEEGRSQCPVCGRWLVTVDSYGFATGNTIELEDGTMVCSAECKEEYDE